jgi:GNAT superfamily N-acetyltransferase
MDKKPLRVIPLSSELQIHDFSSGESILDDYLKKFALENSERGISRAWVALNDDTLQKVLGYYTLSSAHLEHHELPKNHQRGLPKYPIPAIRIGRLAIDTSIQGQRYGEALLYNALFRILQVSKEIGIRYILVDAKHDKAKKFYSKFGFIHLPDRPLKLILPIKTLVQCFDLM